MSIVLSSLPAYVLVAALASASQPPAASVDIAQPSPEAAAGQEAAEASSQQPGASIDLPVSVEKIQKALARPPAIRTTSERPVFRVEILARRPTIQEILGPDYLRGPVPYGGMTHQEFLNMVTPAEYRGYAAFSNGEGMTVAATSLALQWALMKAVDKFKEARDERAKDAARREVMEAMNELEAARKRAGLPPR